VPFITWKNLPTLSRCGIILGRPMYYTSLVGSQMRLANCNPTQDLTAEAHSYALLKFSP
jgi:hypothetical protein